MLNRYTETIRIEGSNPSVSANMPFLTVHHCSLPSGYPPEFPRDSFHRGAHASVHVCSDPRSLLGQMLGQW